VKFASAARVGAYKTLLKFFSSLSKLSASSASENQMPITFGTGSAANTSQLHAIRCVPHSRRSRERKFNPHSFAAPHPLTHDTLTLRRRAGGKVLDLAPPKSRPLAVATPPALVTWEGGMICRRCPGNESNATTPPPARSIRPTRALAPRSRRASDEWSR